MASKKMRVLRARISGGARSAAAGGKTTLIAGGTGAGARLAMNYLRKNVDFFKKAQSEGGMKSYLPAVGLLAVGHFVHRKQAAVGIAIAALAGADAVDTYEINKQMAAASATPSTKGYGDAGALNSYGDAGALVGGQFNSIPESNVTGYEDELPAAGDISDAYALESPAMMLMD